MAATRRSRDGSPRGRAGSGNGWCGKVLCLPSAAFASVRSRDVIHLPVDSPQRQPSLEFPPPLIGELGGALALYVARRTEPELEGVRHALEQLCTVAHRQGLGPERMVIAVKEAWAALPETQRAPSQRETDALRGLF